MTHRAHMSNILKIAFAFLLAVSIIPISTAIAENPDETEQSSEEAVLVYEEETSVLSDSEVTTLSEPAEITLSESGDSSTTDLIALPECVISGIPEPQPKALPTFPETLTVPEGYEISRGDSMWYSRKTSVWDGAPDVISVQEAPFGNDKRYGFRLVLKPADGYKISNPFPYSIADLSDDKLDGVEIKHLPNGYVDIRINFQPTGGLQSMIVSAEQYFNEPVTGKTVNEIGWPEFDFRYEDGLIGYYIQYQRKDENGVWQTVFGNQKFEENVEYAIYGEFYPRKHFDMDPDFKMYVNHEEVTWFSGGIPAVPDGVSRSYSFRHEFGVNTNLKNASATIQEPAAGATISSNAQVPEGANYTATVRWEPYNEPLSSMGSKFENGHVYAGYVRFTANDGYKFLSSFDCDVTINGEKAYRKAHDPYGSWIEFYIMKSVGDGTLTMTDAGFTAPEPVLGKTPGDFIDMITVDQPGLALDYQNIAYTCELPNGAKRAMDLDEPFTTGNKYGIQVAAKPRGGWAIFDKPEIKINEKAADEAWYVESFSDRVWAARLDFGELTPVIMGGVGDLTPTAQKDTTGMKVLLPEEGIAIQDSVEAKDGSSIEYYAEPSDFADKDITKTASDKGLSEDDLKGTFDIGFNLVTEEEKTPITSFEKPVTIELEMDLDPAYNYYVIRNHHGETTILPAKYGPASDGSGKMTLKFESSLFSTFAVYQTDKKLDIDEPQQPGPGGDNPDNPQQPGGNDSDDSQQSTNDQTSNQQQSDQVKTKAMPATGDQLPVLGLVIVALLAAAVMIATRRRNQQ